MESNTAIETNEYMTPNQVCEKLQITPRTLLNWRRDKKIKFIKLPGGGVRFFRSEIESILNPSQENTL